MFEARKIFMILFICFLSTQLHAQRISGTIKDATTKEPIKDVHVFIDGSVNGAITDIDGRFEILIDERVNFTLVFSHVSYDLEVRGVKNLIKDRQINVSMIQRTAELDEVVVSNIKDRKRDRLIKEFKQFFLGEYYESSLITIENEYTIEFERVKKMGYVISDKPTLEIRNEHLGYMINFRLEDYVQNEKYFLGFSEFSELEAENDQQQQKWNENRNNAYWGSLRHLMYSLIKGVLEEEGFLVEVMVNSGPKDLYGIEKRYGKSQYEGASIKIKASESEEGNVRLTQLKNGLFEMYSPYAIQVTYMDELNHLGYPQNSELRFRGKLLVNPNGVLVNPQNLEITGHLLTEGLYEYVPFEFSHVER